MTAKLSPEGMLDCWVRLETKWSIISGYLECRSPFDKLHNNFFVATRRVWGKSWDQSEQSVENISTIRHATQHVEAYRYRSSGCSHVVCGLKMVCHASRPQVEPAFCPSRAVSASSDAGPAERHHGAGSLSRQISAEITDILYLHYVVYLPWPGRFSSLSSS